MLSENIRLLRKQRGFSQEVLAEKLHVVRQTVSKWEKGLSVPDADLLTRLAEALEVPVADLLGDLPPAGNEEDDRNAIAAQLAQINEQLAIRNRRSRRIFRTLLGIFLGFIVLFALLVVLGLLPYRAILSHGPEAEIEYEETLEEEALEIAAPD